jgi:hypothetical protein
LLGLIASALGMLVGAYLVPNKHDYANVKMGQ